jgi:hypothetical protein
MAAVRGPGFQTVAEQPPTKTFSEAESYSESRRVRGEPWVLLLTATVRPPTGMTLTKRADPEQRLQDYVASAAFWSRITDLPIVFCENSGYDLSEIDKALQGRQGRYELVSFVAPPIPREKGKGYGEIYIMREALERSAVIGPATRVIKVTGRLRITNFPQVFSKMSTRPCDVCVDLMSSLKTSDCRMFAATPRFLEEYLFPEAEKLNETVKPCILLEEILASATLRMVADRGDWQLMPVDPKWVGRSGYHDRHYTNRQFPIRQAVKSLRRFLMNRWGL